MGLKHKNTQVVTPTQFCIKNPAIDVISCMCSRVLHEALRNNPFSSHFSKCGSKLLPEYVKTEVDK